CGARAGKAEASMEFVVPVRVPMALLSASALVVSSTAASRTRSIPSNDHVVVERLPVHHVEVGLVGVGVHRRTARVDPEAAPGLATVIRAEHVFLGGARAVLREYVDARRARVRYVARRNRHRHPPDVGDAGDLPPADPVVDAAPDAPAPVRVGQVLRGGHPDLPADAADAPELLRTAADGRSDPSPSGAHAAFGRTEEADV